jgi:SAM-dependent methyltransferase
MPTAEPTAPSSFLGLDPPAGTRESGGMPKFDRAYYERYYHDSRTRVYARKDIATLCRFVRAWFAHFRLPLRRVLDLGCGLGYWRDALETEAPRATYTGVEISDYLCEKFGWRRGSVVDFEGNGAFDLVICQGVLQYLSRTDCERAIENLGRLCRGALYLEVLTEEDWEERVDQRLTDGDVHLRPARWYRTRLARRFVTAGSGLFVSRDAGTVFYALEAGS